MQNNTKTFQYGITVKCIHCKCQKKILPGEVPVGNCDYCYRNFGWIEFPTAYRFTVKAGEEILRDGDIVTVNTFMPVESMRRIYEIQRGALVIYTDPLGDK